MNSNLCDDVGASHKFVADLVKKIIDEEVVPEADKCGKFPLTEENPLREDDLDWLEELAKDFTRSLRKSEIAAIKSGTVIRKPNKVFSDGSAMSRFRWEKNLSSLHRYDCCSADRILVSMLVTAEVWMQLFLLGLFKFDNGRKAEWFKKATINLLALRERVLMENREFTPTPT